MKAIYQQEGLACASKTVRGYTEECHIQGIWMALMSHAYKSYSQNAASIPIFSSLGSEATH